MNKIIITWDKYQECVNLLTQKIKNSEKVYDAIYINDGGFVLAASLSETLNIPITLTPSKDTLFVTDIYSTGKSLFGHKDQNIVSIYTTAWTETLPDFFIFTKREKTHWVVFPWEIYVEPEEVQSINEN